MLPEPRTTCVWIIRKENTFDLGLKEGQDLEVQKQAELHPRQTEQERSHRTGMKHKGLHGPLGSVEGLAAARFLIAFAELNCVGRALCGCGLFVS